MRELARSGALCDAAQLTHQMPSADTERSTAHTIHVSVGATSEADTCTALRSELGGRLLRPTRSSSCVPCARGHHVLAHRNTARGAVTRARAAAARWLVALLTHRATLPTEAATPLTAIARRAEPSSAHPAPIRGQETARVFGPVPLSARSRVVPPCL